MRWLVGLSLIGTLAIGIFLRWFLAGGVGLRWDFGYLRHAHSHLGYYGVLFPLAWLGWRVADARAPSRRMLLVYLIAVVVAVGGFLRAGYGVEAIVASTVVGGIWLISAWRLRTHCRALSDPLALVLPSVVAAQSCVAPIAYFLRRDPLLAQGLVSTFLSLLLLGVLVPSTLAALRRRIIAWPALFALAVLAACGLGVWPGLATRVGLIGYALAIGFSLLRPLPMLSRIELGVWSAMCVGLLALALGLLPNNRSVAIGAIHFVILSVIIGSLAPAWLPRRLAWWIWVLHHLAVGVLTIAVVLQGLRPPPWAPRLAAVAGATIGLWWLTVLLANVIAPKLAAGRRRAR